MALSIEPNIATFLDALMGAYRRDVHVEQRIVEAWIACIAGKGGNTGPSWALFGSAKQANPESERGLRAVARALGDTDERAITTSSAHLSTVLIARRMLHGHIDELREYMTVLQFDIARSTDDRAGKTMTPAIARDIAAIGFTESADRMAYHLARIDATLFELLTRLPVAIEGPHSPQPFPEADLCASGFPDANERKTWSSGATLPIRNLGTLLQPITRATVYGGRPNRGN